MATKDPVDELVDDAWDLIQQAIRTGKVKYKEGDKEVELASNYILDTALKLSARKMNKPRGITVPEDFQLKKTTGSDK